MTEMTKESNSNNKIWEGFKLKYLMHNFKYLRVSLLIYEGDFFSDETIFHCLAEISSGLNFIERSTTT